jgi:hypothetical protein
MAIIEKAPRSATCQAMEASTVLVLRADDFYRLMREQAGISIKIMNRMLDAAADRSIRSSEFLSDMVRWGDGARKRAVLDRPAGRSTAASTGPCATVCESRAGGCQAQRWTDNFGRSTSTASDGRPAIRRWCRARSVAGDDVRPVRETVAILLPGTPPQEALRLAQPSARGC